MGQRDTLTSVAARFDTTPSELSKLNRLGSTFIYPGQQLWVPVKGEGAIGASYSESTGSETTQDGQDEAISPGEENGQSTTTYFCFLLITITILFCRSSG